MENDRNMLVKKRGGASTCVKNAYSGRRVRRGRPRLGTRGGKHGSPSVQGNSPSRSEWLPLDMRTTPPAAMPAFRGFEESSSDGVVNFQIYIYILPHFPYQLFNLKFTTLTHLDLIPSSSSFLSVLDLTTVLVFDSQRVVRYFIR